MTKKVIFTNEKPDFKKYKKRLAFDGLLEKKRQKDQKRLRWNLMVLVLEVLLVIAMAYWAVNKLQKPRTFLPVEQEQIVPLVEKP